MKVMIITVPLRPVPTTYPPFGSLSLLSYLRKHGIDDVEFYNIDSLRPTYDEVLQHIVEFAPSVLGISAVVSTAYEYTKRLSLDVKKALPRTLILVGGNLAASAEILLKKTGADLCAIGEGERTFLDVVRLSDSTRKPTDYGHIAGLAYLADNGELVNSGFPTQLGNDEIYDVDWCDLTHSTDIGRFMYDPFDTEIGVEWLLHDPRAREPHRRGKKVALIPASKGCVARCTFCHRFDKGIRYIPIELLQARIQHLVDHYNAGFIAFLDESFGTDKRWLRAFCDMVKPFDLLWRVGGMRVNSIAPEYVELMKNAGCVSIIYGMETGSSRILQVMEKKTTVGQNRNAMKWTVEAGLFSIIQLVIGMPGETPDTIAETIEFCKYGMTLDKSQNPNNLSINYAQALPGTPLYEFARRKGIIGRDLDGEEAYLLRISDRNAHDEFTTLNFTEFPTLECQTWRPRITLETNYAYVQKFGLDHYRKVLLADTKYFSTKRGTAGYFANPRRLVETGHVMNNTNKHNTEIALCNTELPGLLSLVMEGNLGLAMICYPVIFYRIRSLLPFMVVFKNFRRFPLSYNAKLVSEWLAYRLRSILRRKTEDAGYKSLRRVVMDDLGEIGTDAPGMLRLRQGR